MLKNLSALIVVSLFSLSVAAGCAGGEPNCEAAVDHMMKLVEKDMGKMLETLPEEQRAEAEKKMKEEMSSPEAKKKAVEECKKEKMNPEQFKCLMAAKSMEEAGKCESKKGAEPAAEEKKEEAK
ncbi:MAG: hypothetical protein AAGC55_08745 [Myxococcota bacterium]